MDFNNPQMLQALLAALANAKRGGMEGMANKPTGRNPNGVQSRDMPSPPMFSQGPSQGVRPMPMPQGTPDSGPNPDMQGQRPPMVGAADPAVNAPNKFQPGRMTDSRNALRQMILQSMQNRGLMTP